jgi:hypothetical protein
MVFRTDFGEAVFGSEAEHLPKKAKTEKRTSSGVALTDSGSFS